MDRIKDNIFYARKKMLRNLINLRRLDSSCYCFMHVLLIFFDLTEFLYFSSATANYCIKSEKQGSGYVEFQKLPGPGVL